MLTFKLSEIDSRISDNIYKSLQEEIDFFFDESLYYIDIKEIKDGFKKLIRWNLKIYKIIRMKYIHEYFSKRFDITKIENTYRS